VDAEASKCPRRKRRQLLYEVRCMRWQRPARIPGRTTPHTEWRPVTHERHGVRARRNESHCGRHDSGSLPCFRERNQRMPLAALEHDVGLQVKEPTGRIEHVTRTKLLAQEQQRCSPTRPRRSGSDASPASSVSSCPARKSETADGSPTVVWARSRSPPGEGLRVRRAHTDGHRRVQIA
jgi:hypothetical protein